MALDSHLIGAMEYIGGDVFTHIILHYVAMYLITYVITYVVTEYIEID